MDLKGHIIDQKGLKMYKIGQKGEFLDLNTYFVAEFFLEELEVLPPLLNEKSFCPKTLSGIGAPPPLVEKI